MALGDIANTILSRYKADTSDHRRELKKLRGEERRRHKAMLDEMEAQNAKIDGQIAMWGKVAAGIGAVTGAVVLLNKGFQTYEKNTRLRAAAVNADLNGLREATRGLVSDTELLQFAASTMNGTFGLTQEQVEGVLQGALAIRKQFGVELPEAMERLGQAVREGSTEPIKEFGIVVEAQSDTLEGQRAVINEVRKMYNGLGGDVDLATDAVSRSGVTLANSADSFSESLGRIAVAMEPVLAMFARAAEFWADLTGGEDFVGPGRSERSLRLTVQNDVRRELASLGALDPRTLEPLAAPGSAAFRARSAEDRARIRQLFQRLDLLEWQLDNDQFKFDSPEQRDRIVQEQMRRALAGDLARTNALIESQRRRRGGRGVGAAGDPIAFTFGGRVLPNAFNAALSTSQLPDMEGIGGLGDGGAIGSLGAPGGLFADLDRQAADAAATRSRLAQVFGPLEDFDAYRMAFETLGTAAGAAFQAWIDGSQSMGEAIRSVIAQSLAATGQQMLIEALKHTAYGIGALAIGGPIAGASAAQHFKAAAAFGAGAIAAGATAKALGGGGASAAPSASPAMTGIGGGPSAQQSGPSTQVIMLGDRFDSLNPAAREEAIRRELRRGGIRLEGDFVIEG